MKVITFGSDTNPDSATSTSTRQQPRYRQGSSSIKFSLFDVDVRNQGAGGGFVTSRTLSRGRGRQAGEREAMAARSRARARRRARHIVDWLKATYGCEYRLAAVGHRVVHGGGDYAAPVRLDAAVVRTREARAARAAAPAAQPGADPRAARALAACRRSPASTPRCTRSNPPVAQCSPCPASSPTAACGATASTACRYEYIASRAAEADDAPRVARPSCCTLGNGASMCALQAGRSVASTMGFTAVDGLPMGTRCGAIDPGVLLYLMDERKMDARAIETLIYKQSGLLGVSGVSSDMRVLLESTEPRAKLAVDLFVYRIGRELGSLAAALGGLDAIVFTAGIGEHAASIRERVCRQAAWLGVELDAQRTPSMARAHQPRPREPRPPG